MWNSYQVGVSRTCVPKCVRPGAYFNLVVSLCQHLICCGSVGMSEGSEEDEDVCIRNIYRTGGYYRRSSPYYHYALV